MKDKILDDAFFAPQRFGDLLGEVEIILWEGEPSMNHRSTIFEGSKSKINTLIILLSVLLICIILLIYDYGIGVLGYLFLVGLISFCISERVAFVKKRNTHYAISKDHIFIQQKKRKFKVPFKKIGSYHIIKREGNIMSFKLNTYVPFHNIDFMFDAAEQGLGLQLIEDHQYVKELLDARIREA